MLVDGPLITTTLAGAPRAARSMEAAGYAAAYTFEGPHDPFLPLVAAATDTESLELMTAVAIAFARNPMTLATQASDLHALSGGRFHLGLGSQIRPHIERRFSMPWSAPAARMRDLVRALRAIWGAWNERVPLHFEGEHYTHTLMTPFFDPGPNPYGAPPVWLGGVGPHMTEVAGEVADGFMVHPFSTATSLASVTLPALERGRQRSALPLGPIRVSLALMVATGPDEASLAAAVEVIRAQIAFYGSTPAYRVVLDAHGWGDLQPVLRERTRAGDWAEMAGLVPEELLHAVAAVAAPDDVADLVRARCATGVERLALNTPYGLDPDVARHIVQALRD